MAAECLHLNASVGIPNPDRSVFRAAGDTAPVGAEGHAGHLTGVAAQVRQTLAAVWRPYVETCIEIFGADRCMFGSNFPVDKGTCSYRMLWNAFKRIVAGASEPDKQALFAGTARDVYRLADERMPASERGR